MESSPCERASNASRIEAVFGCLPEGKRSAVREVHGYVERKTIPARSHPAGSRTRYALYSKNTLARRASAGRCGENESASG